MDENTSSERLECIITNYDSRARDIRHIRDEVFLVEQQISREDELDDRDTVCQHALACINNQPVGTGRLDVEKDGKVGRVAVLRSHRRSGVGTAIMLAFEEYATQNDVPRLWFHAQQSAVPFYLALSYEIVSEEFFEAGIPHVVMEKRFC